MGKYKTEEEMLENYDTNNYKTPDGYTSDIAVFTIISIEVEKHKPPLKELKLMLIQRAEKDAEGEPNVEGGNGHYQVDLFNQMKLPLKQPLGS